MTLATLIEQQKQESFIESDKASDAAALGILVARFFQWDGLAILLTAAAALEDANFHSEAEAVAALAERLRRDSPAP